ncbi:hypothetical protein WJ438_17765 [Streptomyces sp. GD-15H]|uniref:hypothetical protein n=1 Tax=Streptomyces sp. GD-15H TaxID=3129112 RepID=UPI003245909A
MSVFSYVIHDSAPAFGSLALVLPPAAMDLVSAPPGVAWRRKKRLTRRTVQPAGVHRGTAARRLLPAHDGGGTRKPRPKARETPDQGHTRQ